MANEYKVNNKGSNNLINTSLPMAVLSPNFKTRKYSTPFGYEKTERWQDVDTNNKILECYKDVSIDKDIKLTTDFSVPTFNTCTTFANDSGVESSYVYIYALKGEPNYICYTFQSVTDKIDSEGKVTTTTSYIKNTNPAFTQADRIIVNLQAGGGSGGGSSQAYGLGVALGGNDGGAGGSGAFASVILNTKILKEHPCTLDSNGTPKIGSYCFQIILGRYAKPVIGSAGWLLAGSGFHYGYDGENGGDAKILYHHGGPFSDTLISLSGGRGGTNASNESNNAYIDGAPGAGGIASKETEYENSIYWTVPIYNGSRKEGDGLLNGLTGGPVDKDAPASPSYTLKPYKNYDYYLLTSNIGGYSGGKLYGDVGAPGGAASYLGSGAKGQNPDVAAYQGGYGAGGGGGKWSYNFWSLFNIITLGLGSIVGGFANDIVYACGGEWSDKSIHYGGAGGKSCAQIYY